MPELMDDVLNSIFDLANVALCFYIFGIGVTRLSMMSWNTHRKTWQIIYVLLVVWVSMFLLRIFQGVGHWTVGPFCGLLATALWFRESRERWLHRAPDYMASNCPHLAEGTAPPEDCPLTNKDTYRIQ